MSLYIGLPSEQCKAPSNAPAVFPPPYILQLIQCDIYAEGRWCHCRFSRNFFWGQCTNFYPEGWPWRYGKWKFHSKGKCSLHLPCHIGLCCGNPSLTHDPRWCGRCMKPWIWSGMGISYTQSWWQPLPFHFSWVKWWPRFLGAGVTLWRYTGDRVQYIFSPRTTMS